MAAASVIAVIGRMRLLANDADVLSLVDRNPFPDRPPTAVRARRYRYRFTTRAERRETGAFWTRQLLGDFVRPITRQPG